MESDEIEKLKAKVEKDHNSRLFLPLAEEYRKAGMLDEAISAILSGLEYQPGYTSARVALGRIYLEKGMLNEARAEFERVIPIIPDNLFAHKKLAEIYKESGELEKAIVEYRLVISLSPNDEDARASLEKLGGGVVKEPEYAPAAPEPAQQREAPEEELPDLSGEFGTAAEPVPEPGIEPQPLTGKDFDEFKSFFSEDTLSTATQPETGHDTADDLSFNIAPEVSPSISSDISSAIEGGEQNFEDFLRSAVDVHPESLLVPASDFMAEAVEETVSPEGIEADRFVPDVLSIDALVAAGEYHKALEAYNVVLTKEPENRHVLQRVTELKAFLKMTGKGEEALIAKLDAFLEAIKQKGLKKADELSGSI